MVAKKLACIGECRRAAVVQKPSVRCALDEPDAPERRRAPLARGGVAFGDRVLEVLVETIADLLVDLDVQVDCDRFVRCLNPNGWRAGGRDLAAGGDLADP